jgi:hypothetical protein
MVLTVYELSPGCKGSNLHGLLTSWLQLITGKTSYCVNIYLRTVVWMVWMLLNVRSTGTYHNYTYETSTLYYI